MPIDFGSSAAKMSISWFASSIITFCLIRPFLSLVFDLCFVLLDFEVKCEESVISLGLDIPI